MLRFIVLIFAALIYFFGLQTGQGQAEAGLRNVEYLYTHANAEAATISSSNR